MKSRLRLRGIKKVVQINGQRKGEIKKERYLTSESFFFLLFCETRKLFELILVKNMSKCLSVLRDNWPNRVEAERC